MRSTSQYADANNAHKTASFETQRVCPVCNVLINTSPFNVSFNPTTKELQAVYLCINGDCRSFYIAYHREVEGDVFDFVKLEPPNLMPPTFPDFVKEVSPDFINIYRQAHEAKERGLDQIAGPGFRKAAEFLIKDYAISITPSREEAIKKIDVAAVVQEFIPDPRVKAVARRAFWLGNDETHYQKKWADRDINDQITLIKLTLDWIEIERESQTYIREMEAEKEKQQAADEQALSRDQQPTS